MKASLRPRSPLQALAVLLTVAGLLTGSSWVGLRGWHLYHEVVAEQSLRAYQHGQETASAVLRELVTREMSLRETGLTEWEMVNRIRDWAYANTDAGAAATEYLLDRDKSFGFYRRSAADLFAAFFQDRGGVLCGGTAHALTLLYRLFGFQADTIDSGDPGVFTHVVTLVKIQYGGRPMLVVQDAYLNLTYVSETGEPYDYQDLLATLLRHEHERIRIRYGSRLDRDALAHPSADTAYFDYIIDFRAEPIRVLPNGLKKYRSRLSMQSIERKFGEDVASFLRREGYPGDLRYLFLYPLGGSNRSIVESAQRMVKTARAGPGESALVR